MYLDIGRDYGDDCDDKYYYEWRDDEKHVLIR